MSAIRTLNEDVVEFGRKAGLGALEAYESTVQGFDCGATFLSWEVVLERR